MLLSVFGVLLITTIQTVGLKTNFSRSGYHQVVSCPRNVFEWEASSQRLNCTNAKMYHCNPYKASQLYEFCYEHEVFKVKKGHCLALTENGILNQDECHYFSKGCPSGDYYSNESYKYQSCLSINGKCYTEDRYCNCLEAITKPTETYIMKPIDEGTKPNDADTTRSNIDTLSSGNRNKYLPGFIVFLVISLLSIGLNGFQLYKCKCQNLGPGRQNNMADEERMSLFPGNENTKPIYKRLQSNFQNEFPQLYQMILTSYTIEDAELFRLLKQKCIIGSHLGFQYLVESRVNPNDKMEIFKQCDENGCLLLHYAAQGGSTIILRDIIEYGSKDLLRYKCIRGQHALNFAIRFKQYDMTEHIIEKLKSIEKTQTANTTDTGSTGACKNTKSGLKQATENYDKHAWGEFDPVYWVAWIGDGQLLHILKRAGFDISTTTKTGLNILHIACMSEKLKEDNTFCKHLLINESDKIDPKSTDLSGWNVCHFASMSNFKVLEFIEKKPNLRKMIMQNTKSKKTCLHIACEYAQYDIVKLIVTKFKQLIQLKDKHGWNALHFAAKGGNVEILKYLLKEKLDIGSLTLDHKTILHIACLGKNADICQYAVNNFSKELLDVQTSEHKLRAVHYLGVQKKEPSDGSEEEILKIFCNSEMDLKALSCKGLTVLDRAIDHLDTEVIRCMVKKEYREKCGVTIPVLSKYLEPESFNNNEIRNIIENAIQEMQ